MSTTSRRVGGLPIGGQSGQQFHSMKDYFLPLCLLALLWPGTLIAQQENAPATSQPDPFATPTVREIQQRLNKGVDGDAQAVKDLVVYLKKLIKEDPKNQLYVAYLGSAYSLRSRDAWITKKMEYLKAAEATMNKAVAADPKNAAVRFVRAINLYHLPSIFGLRDEARADFEKLLGQLEGPNPPNFNTKTRQAIYFYAGQSFYQTDRPKEARQAWQKGAQLDPSTKLGAQMKKKLKSVGG